MPRPERTFRTLALILRHRDFGEADRLLTILTPNHGRREVIAKGARKPTSTRTGHVELYTQSDMLINVGRDLDIAAQAQVSEPYLPLRDDLARGAAASYAADLLIRFTGDSGEEPSALFDLLANTFAALCTHDDPRMVLRYYELRLLGLAGFKPELQECLVTREPLQPIDQYFSYADGGAVSPVGLGKSGTLMPMSAGALKVLRYFQRTSWEKSAVLKLHPNEHPELERLLQGYINYLLERRLQSADFFRRVRE
jgi:DNA repair protein RecO (recombination protein O)